MRNTADRHIRTVAALIGAGALAACATVGFPASVSESASTSPAECRNTTLPDVAWIQAGTADSTVLDAWCAGVGPAVLHAADALPAHPLDSMLVATWNVRVGGSDIDAFVTDLRAGRLTGGGRVDHFVLLIQEAHRAGPAVPRHLITGARSAARIEEAPPGGERRDIIEVAHTLGLHVFYVPSMRNGTHPTSAAEDRGNAILSTLPLTELAAIELPYEAQRRVVALATVEVRDSRGQTRAVRLANMHLDNRSRLARGIATFGAGRGRQARALVDALADDSLAVVGGDINAWSVGPFEIAPRILRHAFADTPASDGKATHGVAGILGWRLDDLFFRGTRADMTGAERVEDRYGSDHHAVIAWVRFTAGEAVAVSDDSADPASCQVCAAAYPPRH